MPHPGDHGGFRPLLDRDSLRSGDRPAADRRGMLGDRSCEALRQIGVALMEGEERQHRPLEALDVPGLGRLPAT